MMTSNDDAHLNHPGEWTTGSDSATSRQKGFLNTLANQKGAQVDPSHMNKSEASAKIEELKVRSTPMSTAAPNDSANPPSDSSAAGGDGKAGQGGLLQDPSQWATGDDPATGKQKGYIAVMAKKAGEAVPEGGMGKSEASEKIGELKEKTGM